MTDFAFQEEDYKLLLSDPNKTLLAREMGLGKTYIALKYFKRLFLILQVII